MMVHQMLSLILLLLELNGIRCAKSEFDGMEKMRDSNKDSRLHEKFQKDDGFWKGKRSLYSVEGNRMAIPLLNSDGAGFRRGKGALDYMEADGTGMGIRYLDDFGGNGFGLEKRALDSLEGAGFGMEKKALDSIEGEGFGFKKRALDALEGAGFGIQKRALDELEGAGFGLKKRALDSLEGEGFGFKKRALDALEGAGFGIQKRALDELEGAGFGLKKRVLHPVKNTRYGARINVNNIQNEAYDRLQNYLFQPSGFRPKRFRSNHYSINGRHSYPAKMIISTGNFSFISFFKFS
uniref:Uncharacterized protein n=1 Tax=Onchocerca volvulus TaxID=6282 RepID=A0A8R1XSL4_ONCVO